MLDLDKIGELVLDLDNNPYYYYYYYYYHHHHFFIYFALAVHLYVYLSRMDSALMLLFLPFMSENERDVPSCLYEENMGFFQGFLLRSTVSGNTDYPNQGEAEDGDID